MTVKRTYFIMLGLLAFSGIVLLALLYLGNQLLAKESVKLLDLKATNQVLEMQQTELIKAQSDIRKYANLEEITQSIVPQDKDQARAVREVIALAQESGVGVTSITFPASNLGTRTTPSPQSDGNAAQTAPQTSNPSISQAKPVQGIKGLYRVEMAVVSPRNQDYYAFLNFLSKLEKNRRTAQISKVRIEPEASSGSSSAVKFNLSINIYVKP